MDKPVLLEYMFLFDSASTWSHLSQFESDLSDFFRSHDLQCEVVKSINGQIGRRILIIKTIDKLNLMVEKRPDERRKQPSSQIKDLAERKLRAPAIEFMKGKK